MTMINARELGFIAPATVRCEGWAEPRELGCVSVEADQVVIGVWPVGEDPTEFDEFRLSPYAQVEVSEP